MSASLLSSQHLFSAHRNTLLFSFVYSHAGLDMEQVFNTEICYEGCISSSQGASDVWFSLRNTTYQNNSIVILEEVGEGDDALVCITNLTTCCQSSGTGEMGNAIGNWYFPNGSRVPGSGSESGFFRSRHQMAAHLQRKRGGAEGIYHCEIPDTMNVTQTIYIGVYSASTGEWSILLQ